MSDTIPLMLSTSFDYNTDPSTNEPTKANIGPFGAVFGNVKNGYPNNVSAQMPLFAAWIIDRRAPNNPVVFKTSWASNTEVPSELSNYLSDAYIMLFGFAGWISDAPAGDLYQMLLQNGGGAELRKLQSWSTALACGVSGRWTYNLISVPATGTPGVEKAEIVRYSYGNTGGGAPYTSVGVNVSMGFQLTVELVLGSDGNYTPVRFGA